jgi:hypothetical protein
MFRRALCAFLAGLLAWAPTSDAALKAVASGVNGGGTVTSSQILAPDGTVGAPSYSFASSPSTGWYRTGSALGFSGGGTAQVLLSYTTNGDVRVASTGGMSWSSTADATQTGDLFLLRDAANTLAQKNSTTAQVYRLYFSTTGPVYWQATARTAGVLYTGSGGAAQVSYAQTTVPTITTNPGTGGACVGTDTAMTCTEGTSPAAAATFTVTFNGTWPAAPSCMAIRGTAGSTPLVQNVVTSTTTVQVNLSANLVASEKYHIHCFGVS